MPISERATHAPSFLLAVALASTAGGWTVAGRNGDHCTQQEHSCTPRASLTCCCHSSPATPDTARLPEVAPPHATCCSASLMEAVTTTVDDRATVIDVTSRHSLRHLDLRILNQTFLI
jgi:hypothetical protein